MIKSTAYNYALHEIKKYERNIEIHEYSALKAIVSTLYLYDLIKFDQKQMLDKMIDVKLKESEKPVYEDEISD